MADALAATAISAVAAAFALQLFARCAGDIRRAQSQLAAIRLADRLYEEARVTSREQLLSRTEGAEGRFRWTRVGEVVREEREGTAPAAPIRLRVVVKAFAGETRLDLETIILPSGAIAPAGSLSPKYSSPS